MEGKKEIFKKLLFSNYFSKSIDDDFYTNNIILTNKNQYFMRLNFLSKWILRAFKSAFSFMHDFFMMF